jgi:hypothetical protein
MQLVHKACQKFVMPQNAILVSSRLLAFPSTASVTFVLLVDFRPASILVKMFVNGSFFCSVWQIDSALL